jgi:hypothetical protein
MIVALAAARFWGRSGSSRRGLAVFTIVEFCVAAAFLLPWIIRNERTLGSPIWARSNTGLELQLSNNDLAGPNWSEPILEMMHPRLQGRENAKVKAMGEVAYNRADQARALSWIASHKVRFTELSAERFVLFWFPVFKRPAQTAASAVLSLLAIAGLFWLWNVRPMTARFFAILWLAYVLPLIPFQTSARFSTPVLWTFYFLAAYFLISVCLPRDMQLQRWFHRKAAR